MIKLALALWILVGVICVYQDTHNQNVSCSTDTECMEIFGGSGDPE